MQSLSDFFTSHPDSLFDEVKLKNIFADYFTSTEIAKIGRMMKAYEVGTFTSILNGKTDQFEKNNLVAKLIDQHDMRDEKALEAVTEWFAICTPVVVDAVKKYQLKKDKERELRQQAQWENSRSATVSASMKIDAPPTEAQRTLPFSAELARKQLQSTCGKVKNFTISSSENQGSRRKFDDIKPTKEQESCICYQAGDLLINGVPGAGKSIVLLKRALEFCKQTTLDGNKTVLFTTYTNTLNSYTTELFQHSDIDNEYMRITTIDSYCSSIYRWYFGSFTAITRTADRKKYVSMALENHYRKNGIKHRFYGVDKQFWCDEFIWMKQRNIQTLDEYLNAERTGRGGAIRITRDDRKIVYEFFVEYCNVLKQMHLVEFEDLYIRIINANVDLSPFKYRYVLVDEAQDFSFVKLKVAKMLAAESITLAADRSQKIYNTGFTWKELGIDIRGNASKTLYKTFRNTKQIFQLAESLAEVNRARDPDSCDYTKPVLPSLIGEDYPWIIQCTNAANERDFLASLIANFLNEDVTIGILCRSYDQIQYLEQFFTATQIDYEEIRRGNKWSMQRKGVKLTTLHSSKGLEFDLVIIPFFSNIYYPMQSEIQKAEPEQVEEIKAMERNLMYVGMTRARSALYLTYSGNPSSFLYEFNPDYYNFKSSSGAELEKPARSFKN